MTCLMFQYNTKFLLSFVDEILKAIMHTLQWKLLGVVAVQDGYDF